MDIAFLDVVKGREICPYLNILQKKHKAKELWSLLLRKFIVQTIF